MHTCGSEGVKVFILFAKIFMLVSSDLSVELHVYTIII